MKNDKKIILGVNSFFGGPHHDNGAFLFFGEKYVGINSERIDRVKQSNGFKYKVSSKGNYILYSFDRAELSIEYCLSAFDLERADVDVVVYLEGLPDYITPLFPNAEILGIYDHHLTHVFSAFYSSGYSDAAVVVIDGQGKRIESRKDEMIVQSIYDCDTQKIERLFETNWQEKRRIGIGTMYEMVTKVLGFSSEGTTMGLSSYSQIRNVLGYNLLEKYDEHIFGNDRFIESVEGSRLKFLPRELFLDKLQKNQQDLEGEKIPYGWSADLASQLQTETEQAMIDIAKIAYNKTKKRNLCIVGGVGLNSVANAKILAQTGFESIYIPPSTDDSGLAFGCALYGKKYLERENFQNKNYNFYFGKTYQDSEIKKTIEKYQSYFFSIEEVKEVEKHTAQLLCDGKVIGWFQGGSESGPRALGNRSILADPRSIEIRDRVNEVKNREWWRPLAPSVLEEFAREYFIFPEGTSESYKYMLVVVDTTSKAKKLIPAVVHIDGTARLQSVNKKDNARYYRLIEAFQKLTGVPVLLNTSFNTKGEPIVETPEEAVRAFLSSGLDNLILGNYVLSKKNIHSELSFKRGVILHKYLYNNWKQEIESYENFLGEGEEKYPKIEHHHKIQ